MRNAWRAQGACFIVEVTRSSESATMHSTPSLPVGWEATGTIILTVGNCPIAGHRELNRLLYDLKISVLRSSKMFGKMICNDLKACAVWTLLVHLACIILHALLHITRLMARVAEHNCLMHEARTHAVPRIPLLTGKAKLQTRQAWPGGLASQC